MSQKCSLDKQKQREFTANISVLQELSFKKFRQENKMEIWKKVINSKLQNTKNKQQNSLPTKCLGLQI